jgi:hypothetical protein
MSSVWCRVSSTHGTIAIQGHRTKRVTESHRFDADVVILNDGSPCRISVDDDPQQGTGGDTVKARGFEFE